MQRNLGFNVKGHIKITDPDTGKILIDKPNSVNYEAMSLAMSLCLANRGQGFIYQMAFGNGGATVDPTGLITYLPPNVNGASAALYNQTYVKVVDDQSVANTDPTRNKMIVSHVAGNLYTDILVQCLLDYGEPPGQPAFDNSTTINNNFTFDELGLMGYYGVDASGNPVTRLLTHVIFHPVQKALNRAIQIDYTLRIQAITNQTI